jgi:hypothetical protein
MKFFFLMDGRCPAVRKAATPVGKYAVVVAVCGGVFHFRSCLYPLFIYFNACSGKFIIQGYIPVGLDMEKHGTFGGPPPKNRL